MNDLETRDVPAVVARAEERARARGFGYSCEPPVGPLPAAPAGAVPRGGRILELGTGPGVGTAWIVSGLGDRTDATVRTVELDADLAAEVAGGGLPAWVEVSTGDAEALVPDLGRFDLAFADAVAGKWTGLHPTVDASAPGGVLVVDDVDLDRYTEPEHRAAVTGVLTALTTDPRLAAVGLPVGSGIVLRPAAGAVIANNGTPKQAAHR